MSTGLHHDLAADWQWLMAPHHAFGAQLGALQTRFCSDHYRAGFDINIQDELLGCATSKPQATPLTDGHHLDGIDAAKFGTRFINHTCCTERNAMPKKCFTAASFADEAHVLAVGFGCGTQTQFTGSLSHLGLGQMSNRKQRVGQFFLVQHVHDITLVFGRISAANHSPHA